MFSKVALLATASLAMFAAASPVLDSRDTCSTGAVRCCNTFQDASSVQAGSVAAGVLAAIVGPITGQVGVDCTPISVIGAGGNSCSAQTACCTGNNFNALVAVGCTPINVGL